MKKIVLFSVFVFSFLFLSAQNNFSSRNKSQYAQKHKLKQIKNTKAACNEQDSLALVAIYKSTGGDDWDYSTYWHSGAVNKWYGVKVSNGRVISLILDGNNLIGTIPSEIGNLTSLQYLDLDNNNLTGSIPSEIGNLTSLQYLDLDNNNLTDSIPAEIGNLTKMQYFDLSYNKFSGAIPVTIGNLKKTQYFILSYNLFSGTIPATIGNIDSLQILDFSYNKFSGAIPATIGNLKKLSSLHLDSNLLSNNVPAQIGNLTNMTILYLDNNQLSGSIPAEMNNLKKLYNCYLNNNKLDSLPDLSGLKSLYNCSIQNNKFDFGDLQTARMPAFNNYIYSPQHNIGDTSYFKFVEGNDYYFFDSVGGSGNQYKWFKNGTAISNATDSVLKLTAVSLSDTGKYYCQITNPNFTGLTLQTQPFILNTSVFSVTFSVKDNNSSPIENAQIHIQNWNKILFTDASGESSTNLGTGNYTAIIYKTGFVNDTSTFSVTNKDENINISLQVACNVQDSLALVALYNSTNGDNWRNKTAWLTEPVYKWYGVTLNDKGRVISLNLNYNRLSGTIPAEIGNLTSLQGLYLSDNHIYGHLSSNTGNLTNLQYLYLSSNQLSGAIPAEIGNLTKLHKLYLYNNQFDSLPVLSGFNSLSDCNIQNNKFDFGDLQTANISAIYSYVYSPQDNIGDTTYFKFVAGNNYSFSDSVGGTGNQYQWYKNGNAIPNETNSVLKLTGVSISDTGKYYCKITNSDFSKLTLQTQPFILDSVYKVIFSIKDNSSQPIKNARITINNNNLFTDALGKDSIELSIGNYTAIVSKSGFVNDTTAFSVTNKDININITLQIATAIAQYSANRIVIYPNPASDNFFVKNAENSVMTITDMFGRRVFRTKLNSNNENISTNNLQSGIYIININLKKSVFRTKIIIK